MNISDKEYSELIKTKKEIEYKNSISENLSKLVQDEKFKKVFNEYLFKEYLHEVSLRWAKSGSEEDKLLMQSILNLEILLEKITIDGLYYQEELKKIRDFEETLED